MEIIEFTNDNVKLKAESRGWEDAVKQSVSILERNKYVNNNYINHIIKDVKKYGPYILIHPGLAIPHSRPENGVNNIGVSLMTLKQPVYFEGNDNPVHVLISFSATDSKKHLEIIKMIVKIVEKGLIDQLSDVETVNELNVLLRRSGL